MKKFLFFIGVTVAIFLIVASTMLLYADKTPQRIDSKVILKSDEAIVEDSRNELIIAPATESKAEFSSSVSVSYSVRTTSKVSSQIIKLNAPYYEQEYEKTCEAASLRMVLEYYGIKSNDWDILQAIGYNPRGLDYAKNVWDDPSEMFVGYVDKGKIGYGAHAEPIAKAAKSFGRGAGVYKNVSARFLAEQISNGHPVIAWGYYLYTTPVKYSWKTEAGKDIFGYRGEHTRVIYGFKGSADNPEGFYVHDPNFANGGADQYWSTKKLMENMNIMCELSNQAVAVF